MSDPNTSQAVMIHDDTFTAPDQNRFPAVPHRRQPRRSVPNQQQTRTGLAGANGPSGRPHSVFELLRAAAGEHQHTQDVCRNLYNDIAKLTIENTKLARENNDTKIHSTDLSVLAANQIFALEEQLNKSQDHGSEVERQRFEIQQQFDDAAANLRISEVKVEDLTTQNQALQARIEDLESSAKDGQRAEQSALEAVAQVEGHKTKLEERVAELEACEKTARETQDHRQIEYDDLVQEKQRLQATLDQAENGHQEIITKIKEDHADLVRRLKIEQREEIEKVRSKRDEAHQEQVNLSTSKYAGIMKQKDSEKAKLQQSYDKLEKDNATVSKTLCTVRGQLNASNGEVSKFKEDLHKSRQELEGARTEAADAKKKVAVAEKKYTTKRDGAAREEKRFKDERAAWERERAEFSEESKNQAAQPEELRAEIKGWKERLDTARSVTSMFANGKAQAEKNSNDLRTKLKEWEARSAEELLETAEARNEQERLKVQLQQQESTITEQKKKISEMGEDTKNWRDMQAFVRSRADEPNGTPSSLADPVASNKPGDHPERWQPVSSDSGAAPSRPMSSDNSAPVAKTVGSKKRPAGSSASDSPRCSKTPRGSHKGRK